MMTYSKIKKEFPCYLNYFGAVKVLSPDSYIKVRVEGGEFAINKLKDIPESVELAMTCGTPITEEEFKAAYTIAMSHVVHEAFMQASEPATDEEIRKLSFEEAPREIFDRNEDFSEAVNELSNHY